MGPGLCMHVLNIFCCYTREASPWASCYLFCSCLNLCSVVPLVWQGGRRPLSPISHEPDITNTCLYDCKLMTDDVKASLNLDLALPTAQVTRWVLHWYRQITTQASFIPIYMLRGLFLNQSQCRDPLRWSQSDQKLLIGHHQWYRPVMHKKCPRCLKSVDFFIPLRYRRFAIANLTIYEGHLWS